MSVSEEELSELQALLSMDGDMPDLEDPPEMGDEAAATAILRRLGELQREAADVESLYEHFELELQRRLALLVERRTAQLEPIRDAIVTAERWLDGWHRAQVWYDRHDKPQRLTINLPTGTLKLIHQPPNVDVQAPELALGWAVEHRAEIVVTPPLPPAPEPRIDGRGLRSFCTAAINALPERPEPNSQWFPVPGVVVTIKPHRQVITPDI